MALAGAKCQAVLAAHPLPPELLQMHLLLPRFWTDPQGRGFLELGTFFFLKT